MIGDSSSITTMSKVHVEVLPERSVAVEVTVVVPTGKIEPEGGVDVTVTDCTSVAVTVYVTTVLH